MGCTTPNPVSGRTRGSGGSFSTLLREVARGDVFSTGLSREQALTIDPTMARLLVGPGQSLAPAAARLAVTETTTVTQTRSFRFVLDSTSFPRNVLVVPGGLAAGARGQVLLQPGDPDLVALEVEGIRPAGPGSEFTLWLISDLIVPEDISPVDLMALPHGPTGSGNQPGAVFTVDGLAPTVGRADVPVWNTVSVVVPAGTIASTAQGSHGGTFPLSREANFALDPAVLLGPGALGGVAEARLPSGVVRDILTDLFVRPATVFPQLNLVQSFAARLQSVRQTRLQSLVQQDGQFNLQSLLVRQENFLSLSQFSRVAVTLEPVAGRTAPRLLPTHQACCLVGVRSDG